MKSHGNGKELTLESAEELAEFNNLVRLAKSLRDKQQSRAEKVLQVFIEGNEEVDSDDPSDSASISANLWSDEMDAMINEHLDHRSIGDFVNLILKNDESAKQAARAIKRHSEHHAMKSTVFEWCDTNMDRFKSMDDAAFDIAEIFVPQKFRTVRGWMADWKKLRSASKP